VAVMCLMAPGPAQAAPGGEPFDVVQSADAVRAYWTPERMRNAIPLGPVLDAGPQQKRGRIAERVRRVKKGAKKTNGKVFLTLGGVNYVCSATAVNAPSDSLVWTAGHCVYEPGALGGGFATNWEFVPAYKNGDKPFGEWPATDLNAATQWKNSSGVCIPGIGLGVCGDVSYDLGAASVATKGGEQLHDVVGARGIDFDGPRDRTYKAYGYPAEGDFDGEHLYRCKSPYGGGDNSTDPETMRIHCDMTAGSSGGGWVTGGEVASVVSYGYNDEPNKLYGPYQGNSAQALYNSIDNG
jgi:hypothetical protein